MGGDACGDSVYKESAEYIKSFCTDRIKKYGLHTVKSGACKSCPYRYRGTKGGFCCIFGNLPYSWSAESINKL